MDNKLRSKALCKVAKCIEDCEQLRGYEIEIGLKSLNFIPRSGVLTQIEILSLSDIVCSCGLHYFISTRRNSICFVIYVPKLILTHDNLVIRDE